MQIVLSDVDSSLVSEEHLVEVVVRKIEEPWSTLLWQLDILEKDFVECSVPAVYPDDIHVSIYISQ